MVAVISPAKNLNFDVEPGPLASTQPQFQEESEYLMGKLRKFSPGKVGKMMKLSADLANLNVQRYQEWELPFSDNNAKPAVKVFNGEVYLGLEARSFSKEDQSFAQDHLRILSGLHGLLRPMDLVQPYRLEMGTSWAVTPKKKNLYTFWGDKIHKAMQESLQSSGSNVLLNLASNEYFKAVKADQLDARVITFHFRDFKNGEYKALMTYAKRARGLMAAFMIKNKITSPEDLKAFDSNHYGFNEALSTENEWVFTRD